MNIYVNPPKHEDSCRYQHFMGFYFSKIKNAEFITRYYEWNLLNDIDPDDNKFIDCAVASNSDYLATNDRHFNSLHEIDFPKINLINLDEFKKILRVSDL